jgi:hypothetical protein
MAIYFTLHIYLLFFNSQVVIVVPFRANLSLMHIYTPLNCLVIVPITLMKRFAHPYQVDVDMFYWTILVNT